MSFPTDQGMTFLLCDDFRHEGDGKLTIFGVIGDHIQVNLPQIQKTPALRSLGICLLFRDGVGKFQMSMELTTPSGKDMLPTRETQQVEKKPDGWMNVALKFEPFSIEIGNFTLNIFLTDEGGKMKGYTRIFPIINQHVETKS